MTHLKSLVTKVLFVTRHCFYTTRPLFVLLFALVLLLPCESAGAAGSKVIWERTLTERLGHNWTAELVRFPIQAPEKIDASQYRLVVSNETNDPQEIPFQLIDAHQERPADNWHAVLACLIDLPAFGARHLRLEKRPAGADLLRPMRVEHNGGLVLIDNGALEVQVPDSFAPTSHEAEIPAPLVHLRNKEAHRWIGQGSFHQVGVLHSLETHLQPGPVFTDVFLKYTFEKGDYSVRLRLIRGQPVILWNEAYRFEEPGARLDWDCSAGQILATGLWDYHNTQYDWRKTSMGTTRSYPLQRSHPGETTTFAPWVPWWQPDVTTWIELWDEEQQWATGIFTGDPLTWNPADKKGYEDSRFRLEITPAGGALLTLPLRNGERSWGLSLARRTPDARIGSNLTVGPTDTEARQIKYAETPLDEVKDYLLEYQEKAASHPRFVCTPAEKEALQAALPKDYPFLRQMKTALAWANQAQPLEGAGDFWQRGGANDSRPWPATTSATTLVQAALAGQAGKIQTHMRCELMRRSLQAVQMILRHGQGPGMAVAPHNWMTGGPLDGLYALADVAMPSLSDEERQVLCSRLLFLAYKLSSERFWSPRLGFGANPNMTTLIKTNLAFLSFLYPQHPAAELWRTLALEEINHELREWARPSGGWLEAPHYATVSLDHIVAVGHAMHTMGMKGPLYDDNLKNAILWLAKISTPPDPGFDNRRHLPPIGNTYLFETSCLFGYMAQAYRDKDPDFAGVMHWVWEQQGYPMHPGIGGAYPTTEGYREVLLSRTATKVAPQWGSEVFPGSGAILRNGFPGPRETQLYLIQGSLHEHYDYDQGSFQLWGKGRPLCLDFGYNGAAPAWQHSRIDLHDEIYTYPDGRIVAFDSQPDSDYLHSQQGPWDRQIMFIKDQAPLGPNYFVIRDSLTSPHSSPVTAFDSLATRHPSLVTAFDSLVTYHSSPVTPHWWLWLNTSEDPQLNGTVLHVKGKDDVDMNIWFDPSAKPLLASKTADSGQVKTKPLALTTFSAGQSTTDQRGLDLAVPFGNTLLWAIYPHLRSEPAPSYELLADGHGVRIHHATGTDYVFQGQSPFSYRGDEMTFVGSSGAILLRSGTVELILHAGTIIKFRNQQVTSERTSRKFSL